VCGEQLFGGRFVQRRQRFERAACVRGRGDQRAGEVVVPGLTQPVIEAKTFAVRSAPLKQCPEAIQIGAQRFGGEMRVRRFGCVDARSHRLARRDAQLPVLDLALHVDQRPCQHVERFFWARVPTRADEQLREVLALLTPDVTQRACALFQV
jgi:hypothetical protein